MADVADLAAPAAEPSADGPAATVDPTLERLDAIATSVADLVAALDAQREDLRAALEVLVELATAVDRQPGTAMSPANPTGIEVGALMGATQAAWVQLEQRLDSEFADIQTQLRSLSGRTDEAATAALEAANRPVVTGAQVRRAATALRNSLRRSPK